MKPPAMASEPPADRHVEQGSHGQTFAKVLDKRKQPIRGLWVRNGRYYAQLTFEDGDTDNKIVRRVPLRVDNKPVASVAQALAALGELKVNRSWDELPVLQLTPKFKDFVADYLTFVKAGEGQKRPATIAKEEYTLHAWAEHMGGVRLDKIRMTHVNAYKTKRLNAGMAPRTVNLDVICLNAALKHAIDEKRIKTMPTANLRPLKCQKTKRPLFTTADLENLCAAALATKSDGSPVTKNGPQFNDYLRFLAYSGAREKEALAVRWQDVDFEREQLTIGAAESTKNNEVRTVDFNPVLRAHLQDLATRQAPDSQWVFPSPQRGAKDIHTKTFRESLKLARAHAGLPHIAFHDCRHHFISMAVMSGVDFMTIASWVGHKDGGVLIGKTYGHLVNEHKKAMAEKMNFGPVIVEAKAAQGA